MDGLVESIANSLHLISFILVERLKASASQFAYKETLVTEMREFVDSFHSDMCIKITAMIERYERAMKEMNTRGKRAKQSKEFEDLCKVSSANRITNPVYSGSPGEHSFDLKSKYIGNESTKCILGMSQPWHSSNAAVLNRARASSNPEGACSSLLCDDGFPVTRAKDGRRETNDLCKSKAKRSLSNV